ncbi:hypothetical protein NB701_003974 [Pantoea ananatis]|nr:hypothetical protein [Pantoea ananatis]
MCMQGLNHRDMTEFSRRQLEIQQVRIWYHSVGFKWGLNMSIWEMKCGRIWLILLKGSTQMLM